MMRVVFVPTVSNPYQYVLAEALEDLGIEVEQRARLPSEAWLVRNRGRVQLVHMHWLHPLYGSGQHFSPLRLARFVEKLILARSLGYKIFWTVHNVLPHERTFPLLDLLARFSAAALTDAIIVHCEYARSEVSKRFSRKKSIHVIPHGHYASTYLHSVSREEARRALNIAADTFVYLFFGKIRPYKGVEQLMTAFKQLDGHDAELFIAGECQSEEGKISLLQMAQGNSHIRIYPEFVPSERVQQFFAAADVLVAPYLQVLTSGSVVLGLSLGLPVIAPAQGCLPELITPEVGILYDPLDEEALQRALQSIRDCDVGTMGREAYRLSRAPHFDWKSIARKTFDAYRECRV
ncbi:MAG: glycosyltransferase [Anaerolineae bacterium]